MSEKDLTAMLGYSFKEESLLITALTHSSYSNEKRRQGISSNERLEFLGDAIFDVVISEYLYESLPDEEEGVLTRYRSMIVREESLAICGTKLGIHRHILLGKGEQQASCRTSIIADAMEAVIAAIYLDGGLFAAREFILRVFSDCIWETVEGRRFFDHKTAIQERLQVDGPVEIRYQLDREDGPDHAKMFYVSVWVDGEKRGDGQGRSKKEAEQHAAKTALEGIDIVL